MELIERINGSKKHWALGPFNPLTIEKKDSKGRHFSMEWLDKQKPKSVIFVSFGTTTTLTKEEIEQIATGLEQSKQKFIWVLRDADKGDIFDGNEVKTHELPNGFEERVNERHGIGLIVRDWAHRDELVTASVIENVVRRLMETKEGDEMRERAMNLKKIIHKSMDEGGVSRMEMESFIAHITR
ncbi:zeatin O-glucosyltransferase-like [Sesbania bispinosa]|nr:zeatin O-glucosyltransferase-like [Sesbania bispinosa]